jgi:subtilase family serine protease
MSFRRLKLAAPVALGLIFLGAAAAGAAPPNLPPRANLPNKPVCGGPGHAQAACNARVVTDAGGTPLATGGPVGYGPVQFQSAYGLAGAIANLQSSGATPTIGIVDAYDDPTAQSDLATYSSTYGLPACGGGCFTKVNQTGGTTYPGRNGSWALEISLDIEVAHATCPSCHILLVEASSNSFANLGAAENEAVALGASVVSNSWGASESSAELANDKYFNHPGTPITVSSGDNGYGVGWPASSQYVTAVGGTTLKQNSGAWSETAWNGSGSGCSGYEPKPAWQKDTGCKRRTVADVSADADPNTGAAVYDTTPYCLLGNFFCFTGWYQVGGTSLASPIIAGVYALANNHGGSNYGSFPYSNPGALNDVVSGSNGKCTTTYFCTAGSGYDGPTGLGTPNGVGAF